MDVGCVMYEDDAGCEMNVDDALNVMFGALIFWNSRWSSVE